VAQTTDVESILNPYGGDLGASISADTPFLPRGNYEMLWRRNLEQTNAENLVLPELEVLVDLNPDSKTPLLDMARTASLAEVIDVLWKKYQPAPNL
jgi:hypothetical protein